MWPVVQHGTLAAPETISAPHAGPPSSWALGIDSHQVQQQLLQLLYGWDHLLHQLYLSLLKRGQITVPQAFVYQTMLKNNNKNIKQNRQWWQKYSNSY